MTQKYNSGFISIIGSPNVGKSTLLNSMIGEKIAIVSSKPQTTRNKVLAILTEQYHQMIFIDTPGIHNPQTKLAEYMVKMAQETLNDVDIILFVVEANRNIKQEQNKIIERFNSINTPVLLIINKIDLVKKDVLFNLIEQYNKMFKFHSIIPVSALNNDGVDIIIDEIKKLLPEGPQYFEQDTITDQPERQIVSELIREKVLMFLQEEVPHGIAVEVISMKDKQDKDIIEISANIYCEKDSHKGIIIGKKGEMLKRIGSTARKDIEKLLGTKVFLELWVSIKKDWRNKEYYIKDFGYRQ